MNESNGSKVKSVPRVLQFAALTIAIGFASPAFAATDIQWWHAMSGELGKQLELQHTPTLYVVSNHRRLRSDSGFERSPGNC